MMRLHIFSIGLSVFTCASAHEEMQYIASMNKLYQGKINRFSYLYGTGPVLPDLNLLKHLNCLRKVSRK